MSVMEVSHRSKSFVDVAAQAEADLRELMSIPAELQGSVHAGRRIGAVFPGAAESFGARRSTADYINTGHWSQSGISEAGALLHGARGRRCRRRLPQRAAASRNCASAAARPMCTTRRMKPSAASSLAMCPTHGAAPLVADMSSSILSRPIEVTRFGMIYAGAQKNIGPSGLTVVIVREDLLGRARPDTPHVFDYKAIADNQSMLNTPPTFAWYMAGLVFKWLKAAGGVARDRQTQPGQGGDAVRCDRCVASV